MLCQNMSVHEWSRLSGRSVEGFKDLVKISLKDILLVELGGPTPQLNIYKEGIRGVPCSYRSTAGTDARVSLIWTRFQRLQNAIQLPAISRVTAFSSSTETSQCWLAYFFHLHTHLLRPYFKLLPFIFTFHFNYQDNAKPWNRLAYYQVTCSLWAWEVIHCSPACLSRTKDAPGNWWVIHLTTWLHLEWSSTHGQTFEKAEEKTSLWSLPF